MLSATLAGALLWSGPAWPASGSSLPVGGFGWPLGGLPRVDRPFAAPTTAYGPGHRGVDLRAPIGAPIHSAGAGRVAYAGLLAGRGVVVVMHAGGLRTTYEPVEPVVAVGSHVGRGGLLGHLTRGHASCRTGTTCLHWGLIRGQTYLDPLALVRPTKVRLLPVVNQSRTSRATSSARAFAGGLVPRRHSSGLSHPGIGGAAILAGGLLLGLAAVRRQDASGRGP